MTPNVRGEAGPMAGRVEARVAKCCSVAGCWASPRSRGSSGLDSACGRAKDNVLYGFLKSCLQRSQLVGAVLKVSAMANIKGHVVPVLSNYYDFLAQRVAHSKFIEDVRIAAGHIGDNNASRTNRLPNVLNDFAIVEYFSRVLQRLQRPPIGILLKRSSPIFAHGANSWLALRIHC